MEPNQKPTAATFTLILIACLYGMMSLGCVTRQAPDPLSPAERLNLGVTYEQSDRLELALREYKRAERGELRGTALAYQGNVHTAMGDLQNAETAYLAALRVNPDELTALNNLAWLYAKSHQNLEEAQRLILHALSLNPDPPDPFLHTLQTIRDRIENSGFSE